MEHHNCHGLVLAFFDLVNQPFWADESDLMHLVEQSEIIKSKDVSVLDFMIIECRLGHFIHSAIYLGNGMWFHKKGQNNIEPVPLNHILNTYFNDGSTMVFYRKDFK